MIGEVRKSVEVNSLQARARLLHMVGLAALVFTTLFLLGDAATAQEPPLNPSSEAAPSGLTAVWDLAADAPVVLTGYAASESFPVELPAGWELTDDATFTSNLSASDLARGDASLRIDADGRPLATWSPGQKAPLRFPVPASLFNSNTFTFTAATTSPIQQEAECRDPAHIARWIDLGRPELEATIVATELTVARAVGGMGLVSQLTNEPITIVVPDTDSAEVLEALGSMVAAVAQHGAASEWVVERGASHPVQAARPGASILIDVDSAREGIAEVEVLDGRPQLTIAGSADSIVQLADALADPNRLLLFQESRLSVGEVPVPIVAPIREVFTLDSAGYGDRTVRGYGPKGLVYRVHLPAGVAPDSATLAILGTYAPSLGSTSATVTVKINGGAEQIVDVLDESGHLDTLHTVTPADLRPGLNFVRIETELGRDVSAECTTNAPDNWLTVSNNTAIGVAQSGNPQAVSMGVEDARFALATVQDFEATDVVIPNRYDQLDLTNVVRLISELSSRSQGGSPRLVTAGRADRDRHLVVVGPAGANDLLDGVPYASSDRPIGVVAATPSPFTQGRVFLAFTGGRHHDVATAIAVAMSPEVNDLDEPYAIIGADEVRGIDAGQAQSERELWQDIPDVLASTDESIPGPSADNYDDWIREQAARLEAAEAPERRTRRSWALGLGLAACLIAGFWWLRQTRARDSGSGSADASH